MNEEQRRAMLEHRFKTVRITPELLQEPLTEGWSTPGAGIERITCAKGLPPGAFFVEVDPRSGLHGLELTFAHPSWEPVRWDEECPVVDVEYQTEYKTA